MTNDEVYYWDWSRHLQLSYIDAPPFVAWLAFLGSHIFSGALGARFFVPFLHFFSVLFLLLSLRLLFPNKSEFKVKHMIALCLLTECIPYFTLEGFLLLPDAALIFSISACLYFILKSMKAYVDKNNTKVFQLGATFGFFLGIGFLSKYQVAPIGLGFLIAFLLCTNFSNWKFQLRYWSIVLLVFIVVSSPVWIWNAQNDWASFRFQTQHGFDAFHVQLRPFFRYLLGVMLFLFPWYFYLFLKTVFMFFKWIPRPIFDPAQNHKREIHFYQLELICILPFLFLFGLILISALGKQALPHWAMPGFFLLAPVVAKHFFFLTSKHKRLWLKFHVISVFLAVVLPALACVGFLQTSILKVLNHFQIRAVDLEQISLWPKLQKLLNEEKSIDVITFPYSESEIPQCPNKTPYLASLRWYWTAQMAFHFENQPRVFNFDSARSYYSWRDDLSKFSGCHFIVVGSESHFRREALEKMMFVETIDSIVFKDYPFTKIIVVRGKIK